jgi:ribonucleotide reductase alpha subunit
MVGEKSIQEIEEDQTKGNNMENENWIREISESYKENAKEYQIQKMQQLDEQKTEMYQKKFMSMAQSVQCFLDEELSRTFGFDLSDLKEEEAGKVWDQIRSVLTSKTQP